MIALKDVCYARLGTNDLDASTDFATKVLGLQITGGRRKDRYLRSDTRGHTLYYFEGDPRDQVVGFELVSSDALEAAAVELEQLGHNVHHGTAGECESRHVKDFIRFKDPSGTSIEAVVQPEIAGRRYFGSRDAGITSFSHVGLYSRDTVRDEAFWTRVCNARVSDRNRRRAATSRQRDPPHHRAHTCRSPWNSTHQSSGRVSRRHYALPQSAPGARCAYCIRAGPPSDFRRAVLIF